MGAARTVLRAGAGAALAACALSSCILLGYPSDLGGATTDVGSTDATEASVRDGALADADARTRSDAGIVVAHDAGDGLDAATDASTDDMDAVVAQPDTSVPEASVRDGSATDTGVPPPTDASVPPSDAAVHPDAGVCINKDCSPACVAGFCATLDCYRAKTCSASCGPLSICDVDCESGTSCTPTCSGSGSLGATCHIGCHDAAKCSPVCQAGASCNIDCSGAAECHVQCPAGAFCGVDCRQGANCTDLHCLANASCGLVCDPGSTKCTMSCPTGLMNCPDGSQVCNHLCP